LFAQLAIEKVAILKKIQTKRERQNISFYKKSQNKKVKQEIELY